MFLLRSLAPTCSFTSSYAEARGHDQPSPNRVGMNLDLEGAIIVFARFVRMASALPCLAARRDMFKSVFGAPLGTSVALGPYGCTKKTIKLKKRFLW